MDMRDKIAGILDHDRKWPDASETADAIIAALPDMIEPLVWRESYGVSRAKTAFGDYCVGVRTLTLPLPMSPQQVHSDEEAAKAAANTHHRAAIMAAFGVAL